MNIKIETLVVYYYNIFLVAINVDKANQFAKSLHKNQQRENIILYNSKLKKKIERHQ